MVLAAPELVVAEPVQAFDQIEIPPELQHRMLADRVVRGEKGTKFETRHLGSPGLSAGAAQSRPGSRACCPKH
jgi:hypothetical protein